MATLNLTITNQVQEQAVNYTGVRVRFQRSTDGGTTYADVQSNVRALGTTADTYLVPAGQPGHYRASATLTDGVSFGQEVFSTVMQVATFNVLTPITVAFSV